MEDKKYVAYYRVSTQKQGLSGLGLEAQKKLLENTISGKGKPVKDFTEVETGKKIKRPELQAAIDFCKSNGCILAVAKLDRLGRQAIHLQQIKESLDILICDMPEMDKFMFGVFALMAEKERELIVERTKAALGSLKARGTKLGKPENLTDKTRKLGNLARRRAAQDKDTNRRAFKIASDLRAQKLSYAKIAEKLNNYGLIGSNGGKFYAVTVSKLFKLYA